MLSAEENLHQSEIPGNISDGTPSSPAPLPVLPEFVVKSTVVREMDVVEPPPMAGLPPVEGTITATVHLVEDPKLPDPVQLPPPAPTDGPPLESLLAESVAESESSGLVFVSATVYDHSRTLLRFRLNSNAQKEVSVWSNLDFNHFAGFSNFEIKAADGGIRRYDLMMGIGNEETQNQAESLAESEPENTLPEIPSLPYDEPAYVFEDAAPNAEAVRFVEDLHELYRREGERMEAAYLAKIQAEAEQRAYYLANPPVPKDVTVNFWERGHPVGMSADTIKKGGGN